MVTTQEEVGLGLPGKERMHPILHETDPTPKNLPGSQADEPQV